MANVSTLHLTVSGNDFDFDQPLQVFLGVYSIRKNGKDETITI